MHGLWTTEDGTASVRRFGISEEGSDVDALESDSDLPVATVSVSEIMCAPIMTMQQTARDRRQPFLIDTREMEDFGIEVREDVPAVPTADGGLRKS